jgi:hypothetical protein
MPFDDYPRLFSYNQVLFDPTLGSPPKAGATCAKATAAVVSGHQVWGIANQGRDGANFHAWENDACNAFGISHYAAKWRNATLSNVSAGMLRLSTLAPTKNCSAAAAAAPSTGSGDGGCECDADGYCDGPFPSIYNFLTRQWEGTIPFANPRGGGKTPVSGWGEEFVARSAFDNAAMGVTAWWQLYHLEHLPPASTLLAAASSHKGSRSQREQREHGQALEKALWGKVAAYGRFLQRHMLENGAVPTWWQWHGEELKVFDCGARSEEGGCVSATSAISGEAGIFFCCTI